jgi:hypothetical protein
VDIFEQGGQCKICIVSCISTKVPALVTLVITKASNRDGPKIEFYENSVYVCDFQIYPHGVEDAVKRTVEVAEKYCNHQEM